MAFHFSQRLELRRTAIGDRNGFVLASNELIGFG